ncbi:MAG: hypothetical protein IT260_20220 [Saprospiraceae bacterium]|nr:hypothetical protein [Saprospiraceae bacterium]
MKQYFPISGLVLAFALLGLASCQKETQQQLSNTLPQTQLNQSVTSRSWLARPRPFGPFTFEMPGCFGGCVPSFGTCVDNPFSWPSIPYANLAGNQVAGQVSLLEGDQIFFDMAPSSLSPDFVQSIIENPVYHLSTPYSLPQALVDELYAEANLPAPQGVVFEAGDYPVEFIGNPTPGAQFLFIYWYYDMATHSIHIVIQL